MKLSRALHSRALLVSAALTALLATQAWAADVAITGTVNGSPLTISANTTKFAGAINSVTYRGQQYVNATDHGRELQSASSFDGYGECYNPTEAGSRNDGTSSTSSSISLSATNTGGVLQTSTNMAFWLAPGTNYGMACGSSTATTAQNTTVQSGHTFSKTVSLGYAGVPNLIGYDVNFHVTEAHTSATFEALTGYMPATFNKFLTYDPNAKQLTKMTAGATGTAVYLPVIVATTNGTSAMGVTSPAIVPGGPYYNYFSFAYFSGNVSKWNCVFNETSIAAGSDHSFSCPVAIGTVDEVLSAINNYSGTTNSNIPIYRFIMGVNHLWTPSYTEGANATWNFEGTAFRLYPAAGANYVPLYRCRRSNGVDHFASTASNCEGVVYEGVLGYISSTAGAGLAPLYRFVQPSIGQHLITIDYNEGVTAGYTLEGTLGYVPV
jgi:hypothetical protein